MSLALTTTHENGIFRGVYLLYLAVLTPVASPKPLLYPSLPTSIYDRYAIGRRRKDDTHVGTAA